MFFLIKCNNRSIKSTSYFEMNTNNTSGVGLFSFCSHTCIFGAKLIEIAWVPNANEKKSYGN